MTERKWASGPWLVTATPDLSLFVCEYGSHDIIATIGTVNRNDAHLIAAAPDLYEALEDAIKQLEEVTQEFMGETYNDPRLNAALAKARGET